MSAAARKRIGDAQRKRWAESKGQSEAPSPVAPETAKPKRKLSAAGKKAIADATKRRWARVRAEAATAAKSQQAPAAKKAVTKKAPVKASRKAAKKMVEMSEPTVNSANGTTSRYVNRPVADKLNRAMPHVRSMLTVMRDRDRTTALAHGETTLRRL